MSRLAERAAILRARIARACEASGREPGSVELLPVSKFQPLDLLREALALDFTTFGENYVQEGAAKAQALPEARFVLQGPLQRNKAKPALCHFQEILTVDRLDLVERLDHLAEGLALVRPVWVQVDLWDEATKMGGCREEDVPALLDRLRAALRLPLQGFMAIPPPHLPDAFSQMAAFRAHWEQRLGQRMRLSMGMSLDLEEAIRAGSDQVRVGTALFGDRP